MVTSAGKKSYSLIQKKNIAFQHGLSNSYTSVCLTHSNLAPVYHASCGYAIMFIISRLSENFAEDKKKSKLVIKKA
ncbi:MAG: hypothetical protein NVS4B11_23130 [Ktedonobacteraceae bacterium]